MQPCLLSRTNYAIINIVSDWQSASQLGWFSVDIPLQQAWKVIGLSIQPLLSGQLYIILF